MRDSARLGAKADAGYMLHVRGGFGPSVGPRGLLAHGVCSDAIVLAFAHSGTATTSARLHTRLTGARVSGDLDQSRTRRRLARELFASSKPLRRRPST